MEITTDVVGWLNGIVWGVPMLVLILGTGFYLMLRLGFMPLLKIGTGFREVWRGRKSDEGAAGEITPFAALMTSLAATVGTGNIAGVATAIVLGGPGALFWMWATALVGMATKYAEVVLAVHFREQDANGDHVGGPMYVARKGLSARWKWLGGAFAIFGGLAGFGIGNMVQANAIADGLNGAFGVPEWGAGLATMLLTALVVLGGIRRIGAVAQALVPAMCVAYMAASFVVLIIFSAELPGAIQLVFESAFTGTAAMGGFAGAAVWAAMRFGVARGVFSNEAGLGTAGIAQAAGMSNSPVQSGLIGMMGTFIDTIIVCSMTGLAIIASGVWTSGESGAALTGAAFASAMPDTGRAIVAIALAVFAFTTILGWAYYGERCWEYLVGEAAELPFRVLWVLAIPLGAVAQLDFIWLLADTLNALMALPNLLTLLLLSGLVVKLTRDHFNKD